MWHFERVGGVADYSSNTVSTATGPPRKPALTYLKGPLGKMPTEFVSENDRNDSGGRAHGQLPVWKLSHVP